MNAYKAMCYLMLIELYLVVFLGVLALLLLV